MKTEKFMELTAFEGDIPSELSGDFILPDVYPDVKKILRVNAKPVLTERYISANRMEFSGTVDYTVLFSADTESGESLHCVHFAHDFSGSLPTVDGIDSLGVSLTPTVSACTVRLANPRKFALKSTVATRARVSVPCDLAPTIEGARSAADESSVERLTQNIAARRERTFLADVLRISENLEPDATEGAIDEIISCNARVYFNEAKINPTDFTVALKGTALVNTLYKAQSEAGVYQSFSRKIPVMHTVDASEYAHTFAGCRPESLCAYARATTVEINAEAAENAYGERRILELDVSADVCITIVGGEDVGIVLDAYSTACRTECVMREYAAKTPGKIISASFSVGQSVPRSELSIPEGSSLTDARIEITSPTISAENGRLLLTSTAAASVICDTDGTFAGYGAVFPIKCELNAGETVEPITFDADLIATDVRARLDSEGICFDFEVSMCAEICGNVRQSAVSAVRMLGERACEDCGATLTLCYPEAGEALWNVAKRYGTTVAALEAANVGTSGVLVIPAN